MLTSPVGWLDGTRVRPEAAPGGPRRRFRVEQVGIGTKPAEDPGMAFGDELAVDVAIVHPERAEQSTVLVVGGSLQIGRAHV